MISDYITGPKPDKKLQRDENKNHEVTKFKI